MKNKVIIAILIIGFNLNAITFEEVLEEINVAKNFEELQNIDTYPISVGQVSVTSLLSPEETRQLQKEWLKKHENLVALRLDQIKDVDELINFYRYLDKINEIYVETGNAFSVKIQKIIEAQAVKLKGSHGKIVGGAQGKVWGTIVGLKKKLPGAGLPSDVIASIAGYVLNDTSYSDLEKINIALELAADPNFVNAKQYFENYANTIIKSYDVPWNIKKMLGYKK